MLLNFTCSNFRSLRDEQTLSMLPGSTRNHQNHIITQGNLDILCLSVIYGANASGKSNIYKAMRFSRDFILGRPIDKQSYFRLDSESKGKPSTFEYEFTLNGNIYRYGFQLLISEGKIGGEWLWRVSDNESEDDRLIYQKPLDANPCPKAISKFKLRTSRYLILTLVDELRHKKDPDVMEIVAVRDWFENNLKIIGTDENMLDDLDYTEEECMEIGRLLADFDVGISAVSFQTVSEKYLGDEKPIYSKNGMKIGEHVVQKDSSQVSQKGRRKIGPGDKKMVLTNDHGYMEELFLWYDESDGTRRLLDLASILVSSTPDITYIIDELDRSLHPMVVYEMVRRFATSRSSGPPRQLLFTTHQTCLLDQDLLRRDEIWFVQKERDGHSDLYSLDEYEVRFDKNIEKMYLAGRFNAIPKIIRGEQRRTEPEMLQSVAISPRSTIWHSRAGGPSRGTSL